jgi:hypothetical protein
MTAGPTRARSNMESLFGGVARAAAGLAGPDASAGVAPAAGAGAVKEELPGIEALMMSAISGAPHDEVLNDRSQR